jgi:hypothetical protein
MSYLRRLRATKQLTALSARVVDGSHEALLDRVLPGVLGLSAAQAKGYVRAWSRRIVRQQVAIAIPVRSQHDAWLQDEVAHRATNDVVNRVCWEAMRRQFAVRPAERRAA